MTIFGHGMNTTYSHDDSAGRTRVLIVDDKDYLRADLEGRKCGFLAKPFRKDELLRKAKELLLTDPTAPWSRRRNLV